MKRWFPSFALVAVAALGLPAVRAAAPPPALVLPDLSEYRTVDKAVTTRISAAAPTVTEAQPSYLGVLVEAKGKELVLVAVEADSPAAAAGLKVGDVLQTVDGKAVEDAADLGQRVRAKAPGETLKVVCKRKDKTVDVAVKLGATSRPLTPGQRAVAGVQLEAKGDGVAITSVTRGSPADTALLKAGDVIVKVDGAAVKPSLAEDGFAGRRPGDVVILLVKRDGKELEFKITLGADRGDGRRGGGAGWDTRRARLFRKPVYKLAVVAVEYPDVKHNPKVTTKDWEESLFSTATYTGKSATGQAVYGSMNDYYLEQSIGALKVEGKVFDWVEVKNKRAAYADNSNRFALLTEALDKLYERDGKGALKGYDGIFFMYAGDRVSTRRGGLYWPHKANLSHGGQRWDYFICPEGGKAMASISVITHEFGHMLGLPDLYAQPERPGSEGLGIWCTMSTGHGRDGKPLHFCAWSKEAMGWLKPAVIDPREKQKIILAPVLGKDKECVKVLLKTDGSEYILLENRVKKNFDRDLPGQGLLIWRVVDGRPVLQRSHGIMTPDGPARYLPSIPYPSASNNAYTPHTLPSSKSVKPGGLPVHITNIRRLPDGRITFHIGYEYL